MPIIKVKRFVTERWTIKHGECGENLKVKAEMLSLLCAKSMGLELSSASHDSVTAQDIAHFLGTKGLTSAEYDLLLTKYADDSQSRINLFDEIFEDGCRIFLKHVKPKLLKNNKYLMRNFINLALREMLYSVCFVCNGRGSIITENTIHKCVHCNGTGQFIYDDNNRPEFIDMNKEEYNKFKKPYAELLSMVKNLEISALGKIGDE
jgi:hypothetical protein